MIKDDVKIYKLTDFKDLKKWVNWLNDKTVTKYSEQRFYKHNLSTQRKFIKKKISDKSALSFKIYYKKIFVGVVELGNLDFNHSNCEIMYFIGDKKLWGKGIASRAIKLAILYARDKLKIKKIIAGTYKSNRASQKVLLNNGFKIEGKIKNYFKIILKNKNFKDTKIIFGLDCIKK